jgi:hypothetical protein
VLNFVESFVILMLDLSLLSTEASKALLVFSNLLSLAMVNVSLTRNRLMAL